MDNISYMMVPIQQRSHYFTNQQVSFVFLCMDNFINQIFQESLGNQLLQFWEFYRDPSSEQNSQKLLTLTQAATSTTVSTKTGSSFRDWMLRKNRTYRTVGIRSRPCPRRPIDVLEDRFSLSTCACIRLGAVFTCRVLRYLQFRLKQSFQRSIYTLLTCYQDYQNGD